MTKQIPCKGARVMSGGKETQRKNEGCPETTCKACDGTEQIETWGIRRTRSVPIDKYISMDIILS